MTLDVIHRGRNINPCPQKTSTQNCDEYPHFATMQGGPFAGPTHPQADLRNIDATQQMQGSYVLIASTDRFQTPT